MLCLKCLAGPAGVPGGSAALEKQIEDLTVDLSKFTCEFFRVEVRFNAFAAAGVACQNQTPAPCQEHILQEQIFIRLMAVSCMLRACCQTHVSQRLPYW